MKTNKRIKRINQWLTSNPAASPNYKILIIDDEADYASTNSGKSEDAPSSTNQLLRNLVNGYTDKGKKFGGRYGSMNYVAFTATPYANLLNECGKETLYPESFIASIKTSNRYFGAQQIFGVHTKDKDYTGLPIYIESTTLDEDYVAFEKHPGSELPPDLKESIAWFIAATAALRVKGYKKPLSMMINTSPNTDPHKLVGMEIVRYINENRIENSDLRKLIKVIYEQETKRMSKEKLLENYPDYWGKEYPQHEPEILEYPEYSEIISEIDVLLSDDIKHIDVQEGEPKYLPSLHICLENSKGQKLTDNQEEYISKIRYPEANDDCPDAPAFIIVGGNILSRGLTLKGLISTYFYRPIKQADTLMQMGRWFGYRPGYELYPRIWLSSYSLRDFEYLAALDEGLKNEIRECNYLKNNPRQCAIKLLAIPEVKKAARGWLKRHTDPKKEKEKIASSLSYMGKYEEFDTFRNDIDQLKTNYESTVNFLNKLESLGYSPEYSNKPEDIGWNVYRWKNVPTKVINEFFLEKYHEGIDNKERKDSKYNLFKVWMGNMATNESFPNWTILLSGIETSDESKKFIVNEHVSIGKVNRSRKIKKDKSIIDIKTLRSRKDLFKDLFPSEFENKWILNKINSNEFDSDTRKKMRELENLKNPLMIIYCIDKDSKFSGKENHQLCPIESVYDIIGFLIDVPNGDENNDNLVQIDLDLASLNVNEDEE